MGYTNISDINELQYNIMKYIGVWVHSEDTPISQVSIISEMTKQGSSKYTTINAINALLRKGYIRRGVVRSNSTFYVQIRTVS